MVCSPTLRNVSYVYFLKSDCFRNDLFKLVVSNAAPDDVITAHKDVFCAKEEDVEPKIHVSDTKIVYDKELLRKSRFQLSNAMVFPDYYLETERTKVNEIIDVVNSLTLLVKDDIRDCRLREIEYHDFILSEDVACFDPGSLIGYEETRNEYNVNEHSSCDTFVPMTRMIELREREDFDSVWAESWSPSFAPFLVFNRGYGYALDLFREMFPEFTVIVHDNFPKHNLAEDMLWYQLNRTYTDPYAEQMEKMVEKIRSFFDCGRRNETFPECDTGVSCLPQQFATLPQQFATSSTGPNGLSSFECLLYPPVATEHPPVYPVTQQSSFLQNAAMSRWENESQIPVGSHQSLAFSVAEIPDALNRHPMSDRSQSDRPPHLHRNESIMPTDTFAAAFQIMPSPCKNAFSDKEHLWNNDTRKEITEVTVHAERRIILREFIDKRCHVFEGSKVKSSKLFEMFKEYYRDRKLDLPFEKAFNQTSFTMIMKQISTFQTKREKDGVYWLDLHVGLEVPERNLASNRMIKPVTTKVNIKTSDDASEDNAITFAELFCRSATV